MHSAMNTALWAVVLFGSASLITRVVQVLSVDISDDELELNVDVDSQWKLGDSIGQLVWFIQISDLHLSIFQDASRSSQFQEFCTSTVDVVKPVVVLASGDLTDAKTEDKIGSKQFVEEWIIYRDILKTSGVMNKTIWLDVRGNHDNFNVASLKSSENFYQRYSVQGRHHMRSYMHVYTNDSLSVAFIAVDACLLPGPRRPFNFIGMISPIEMSALEAFERKSRNNNHTIWFGHYPTSCILSPEPGLRRLMGSGLAYLCGHLHTIGGLVPHMYTRQKSGSLELELGDWKDSRYVRVCAIDHGLFSFVDVKHGVWPIVLVTNPKHALFLMHSQEPLSLITTSSHIRVLVWSLSPIIEVRLQIDASKEWTKLIAVEHPLWVAPWHPMMFNEGIHTMKVFAKDSSGYEIEINHAFSIDETQPSFAVLPRLLLMSNVPMVCQFFFGLSVCICVLPLCILKYLHHLTLERRISNPTIRITICNVMLRKLWVMVSVDRIFWPLMISCIYIPFGPWFIGDVIEGHIGAVFSWGTIVNSSFLPGSLTYAYGFIHMMCFQLPLIIAVAHAVDLRFSMLHLGKRVSFIAYMFLHLILLIIVAVQMLFAYFFWLAYGTMALILGPLRTWSVVLAVALWYLACHLNKHLLRGAALVWCVKR